MKKIISYCCMIVSLGTTFADNDVLSQEIIITENDTTIDAAKNILQQFFIVSVEYDIAISDELQKVNVQLSAAEYIDLLSLKHALQEAAYTLEPLITDNEQIDTLYRQLQQGHAHLSKEHYRTAVVGMQVFDKLTVYNQLTTYGPVSINGAQLKGKPALSVNGCAVIDCLTVGTINNISPGSDVISITGDSGDAIPAANGEITFNAASTAGSTVAFFASDSTVYLRVTSPSLANTIIGLNAGNSNMLGTENTALGYQALASNIHGNLNSALGYLALANNIAGDSNTAIGNAALYANITGSSNVAIGYHALEDNTSGPSNVAVGFSALNNNTTGANNTAIGMYAMPYNQTGSRNIAIGSAAALYYNGSESNNIAIGNEGVTGESNVIRIGTQGTGSGQQDACYIAGIYGVTQSDTTQVVTIDSNGQLGSTPGSDISSITGDIGSASPAANGEITFSARFTAGSTVAFSASGSTVDLLVTSPTTHNTFIGLDAGSSSATGGFNVALGYEALASIATGDNNTAIGSASLFANGSGSTNTAIGNLALQANGSGSANIAIGNATLYNNTSGSTNTAIGTSALYQGVDGNQNIAVGAEAGYNYTGSESNNIVIGNEGVTGESNVIRIGTQGAGSGEQDACYIAGITGVTIPGGTEVFISPTTGQLGTISSSRRYKENIAPVTDHDKLMDLEPVQFTYKSDGSLRKQYGLIAEDVYEIYPELVVHNKDGEIETVRYNQLHALLLKGWQEQQHEIESQQQQIDALCKRCLNLEACVAQLMH